MNRLEFGSIQYLRGVAAFMVVLQHALAHVIFVAAGKSLHFDIGGLQHFGNSGVDLFFVISGFVMASSTERLSGGWGQATDFLRRRALRIYPMYWVFLSVYLFLSLAADFLFPGSMENEKNYSLAYLVNSYLLIPSYNGDLIAPYLGVGWSLYFEVYFYVLVGFVVLLGTGARGTFLVLIMFSAVAFGVVVEMESPVGLILSSPLLFEFLLGWFAFSVFLRGRFRLGKTHSFIVVAFGILIFILSIFFYGYTGIYDGVRVLWWGVPSFMVIVGLSNLERNGWKFDSSYMLLFGAASYAMYLSHKAFTLPVLNKLLGFGTFSVPYAAFWFLMLAVGSIIVGVVAHLHLEVPLQEKLVNWARSSRSANAQGAK